MIGIYKFTNKLTGEVYIGQSVNIQKRYNQHKNRYDKFASKDKSLEDTYFHSMLRNYGFHNFSFEILEECSREELNDKEIYYIAKFNSQYPSGYNRTAGGNKPHPNKFNNIKDVIDIQNLLKTSTLSNIEIGEKYGVSDQTISDINSGRIWFDENIDYPIRNGKSICHINGIDYISKEKNYCKSCGKEISKNTKNNLCEYCFNLSQRKCTNRPDKNTLYNLLLNNSFISVGKMFGVTDNAVRKWCTLYSIPSKSKYYRLVSS